MLSFAQLLFFHKFKHADHYTQTFQRAVTWLESKMTKYSVLKQKKKEKEKHFIYI